MAAHRNTLIQLVVAGVIALPSPAILAWGLSAKRLGTCTISTSKGVPQQAVDRTPNGWVQLDVTDEWNWFGVTRSRYGVGAQGWDWEVALWRVQAGWPLRCMDAHWHQDGRGGVYAALRHFSSGMLDEGSSGDRSLTKAIADPFTVGLNVPKSVRDAPSFSWVPIRPIIFNYLVNAAIYMIVLFALCKTAIYAWDPRAAVRRKRVLRNQCPHCGYSIVGLSHPLCPECGAAGAARPGLGRDEQAAGQGTN